MCDLDQPSRAPAPDAPAPDALAGSPAGAPPSGQHDAAGAVRDGAAYRGDGAGRAGGGGDAGGAIGSAGEAVGMVLAGLGWLAGADLASVPVSVQADCLRELERAGSVYTAARASVLSAFDYAAGFAGDGQGTSRSWLRWQTRITPGAASGAVGWMRRLRAHPHVAGALGRGEVSASWAREICEWTGQLPESARGDADAILLAAAAGGAGLADLAGLAEQMRRALARPDRDNDGFEDRRLRLATTSGGAGKLDGDLTPGCAAALRAVLDALGKRAGPEDSRTMAQRHHDALAEACRRLVAAGGLPDRAGQPTRIQLHIGLDDLTRRMTGPAGPGQPGPAPGGGGLAAAAGPGQGTGCPGQSPGPRTASGDWAGRLWPRLTPDGSAAPEPAVPWPAAAPGEECDASIVPVVTGHLDHDLLGKLTAQLTAAWPARTAGGNADAEQLSRDGDRDRADRDRGRADRDRGRVRDLIAANAIALLSGPHGLASYLRTGTLTGPAASVSLPLDTGTSTDTIPPHLRRAVITRDRHCAAPGCLQPPPACQVHHIRPRSQGGRTALTNMILLCTFHHLIAVHRWGWSIALHPDGTTTMTSPGKTRIYHSHSPPTVAA